jgi:integrase
MSSSEGVWQHPELSMESFVAGVEIPSQPAHFADICPSHITSLRDEMDRGRLPYHVDLFREDDSWKVRVSEDLLNERGFKEHRWRAPVYIGPAAGPGHLTRKQAQRLVWKILPVKEHWSQSSPSSSMTLADFVENIFVPEHVAHKGPAGRTHYRAILKHVLTPEEVLRVFKLDAAKSRVRLKADPDWPYLTGLTLADTRPEHVEKLMRAAQARGYSMQMVTHIRNVVSSIFSHAIKANHFQGTNPASHVSVPGISRKESHTLSLAQLKAVLGLMRYPEKEIALFALLTDLNVSEICGLQWKHVNLSPYPLPGLRESIPPYTIAVRKQWYRGELRSVKIGRARRVPIPEAVLPILLQLRRRDRYTRVDDFVLISQAGTPVHEANLASRRLKAVGRELDMPWLSWQVFLRTGKKYLQRPDFDLSSRLAGFLKA